MGSVRSHLRKRPDRAEPEPTWKDAAHEPRWVGPWLAREAAQRMVDLEIDVALPWEQTRAYEYSKLYVAIDANVGFSEERVVCFRLESSSGLQRMRLMLPDDVGVSSRVQLRVDPFPFCSAGLYRVVSAALVDPTSADSDPEATRHAELRHLKQSVRRQVEESERGHAEVCEHPPESLSLELTPRCNLTCGHCGTHGTSQLHKKHNAMAGMDPETLTRLAEELFPSLTGVTVVGRGEPLLADDATWQVLLELLRFHGVFLRFVTNGTLLRRRLTPDVMPTIDMITVSIDGNSDETMRVNRGGVRLTQVLDGVRHFHELRRAAGLARRPRLCLSWTLKRNNIHEFPEFIERMAEFEPDLVYARHLIVNFEKDRDESLLGDPELANRFLRPAYSALRRLGINSACPPLMNEARVEVDRDRPTIVPAAPKLGRCPFIHRTTVVNSNGDIPTCTTPRSPLAGTLGEAGRFSDVWNGPTMLEVRRAMGTPDEWDICRSCYNREGHYAEQRAAAAKHEPYNLDIPVTLTKEAWDFGRNND